MQYKHKLIIQSKPESQGHKGLKIRSQIRAGSVDDFGIGSMTQRIGLTNLIRMACLRTTGHSVLRAIILSSTTKKADTTNST